MGERVTCMGTLHPRPIYLFDFKNLDTGKQILLLQYFLKKLTVSLTIKVPNP